MMKIKIILITLAVILIVSTGCTSQERAKYYGGEYIFELPAGKKLVNVTWKEDTLWYLTRDAKEGETAEKYEFKADSSYGIFEGTVHIIEISK